MNKALLTIGIILLVISSISTLMYYTNATFYYSGTSLPFIDGGWGGSEAAPLTVITNTYYQPMCNVRYAQIAEIEWAKVDITVSTTKTITFEYLQQTGSTVNCRTLTDGFTTGAAGLKYTLTYRAKLKASTTELTPQVLYIQTATPTGYFSVSFDNRETWTKVEKTSAIRATSNMWYFRFYPDETTGTPNAVWIDITYPSGTTTNYGFVKVGSYWEHGSTLDMDANYGTYKVVGTVRYNTIDYVFMSVLGDWSIETQTGLSMTQLTALSTGALGILFLGLAVIPKRRLGR